MYTVKAGKWERNKQTDWFVFKLNLLVQIEFGKIKFFVKLVGLSINNSAENANSL